MGVETKIEWTDHTFNPWWGCQRVSPGCAHCYADSFAKRVGYDLWGNQTHRIFGESHWREPVKWNAAGRARVFCASMADVFEDAGIPAIERPRLWTLIRETPRLDWLLLTKRPHLVLHSVPDQWRSAWPGNVWVGTSVEDQERADDRIQFLLEVPAPVRFLSCEPLLGPLDLRLWLRELGGIQWVIVGGESGPRARGCDIAWIRSVIEQCREARVPVFVKQLGARPIACAGPLAVAQDAESIMRHGEYDPDPIEYRLRDRKGGDMDEWPTDLRIREFPPPRAAESGEDVT